MVLPDISHCLNLTLDIFQMIKDAENVKGSIRTVIYLVPTTSGLHKSRAH